MSIDVHTISLMKGTSLARTDRVLLGAFSSAMVAGGAAGAAVTVAVAGLELPASYVVHVGPDQDAVCFVSAKTSAGFTINVSPRLAANTLAAGNLDVAIFA